MLKNLKEVEKNQVDNNFLRGVYFLALQIFMVGPLLFVGVLINIRKVNLTICD